MHFHLYSIFSQSLLLPPVPSQRRGDRNVPEVWHYLDPRNRLDHEEQPRPYEHQRLTPCSRQVTISRVSVGRSGDKVIKYYNTSYK